MSTTETTKPWDFSHVLDLANCLSLQDASSSLRGSDHDKEHHISSGKEEEQGSTIARKDFASQATSLGDFSKLFQQLGISETSTTPSLKGALASYSESTPPFFTTNTGYTSDGATHSKPSTAPKRTVRWQEFSDTDDAGTEAVSDSSVVPESPTLTKSQRKKRNRRERKAKEAAVLAEKQNKKQKQVATVSESEADFVSRKAPAKKASVHVGRGAPQVVQTPRELNVRGKTTPASTPKSLQEAAKIAAEKVQSAKRASNGSIVPPRNEEPRNVSNGKSPTTPKRPTSQPSQGLSQQPNGHNYSTPNSRPSTSVKAKPGPAALQFLPATVGAAAPAQLKSLTPAAQPPTGKHSIPNNQPFQIRPMMVRSGEDRHWALLLKLIGDHKEDLKHLLSPMNLTTHNNDATGIHVFVDASNIFIGFNDQLKRSRGIPPWTQMPPVDLSFDALALLMERRRPVAKRVLAGSNPWLPAFDKAKAVGYECSILEKVYKARELTERQIFFKDHDRYGGVRKGAKAPPANNVVNANYGGGSGSGSETSAPQYAPARMIEQGVDEILHLKILESIVDAEQPATMVLATGDAAQAEYSQGFMAMAERALKKGWRIELVSWSKNISAMYRRREWQEAWGERFRIILLDDYAEELLDM